jgi:hypothetical protein
LAQSNKSRTGREATKKRKANERDRQGCGLADRIRQVRPASVLFRTTSGENAMITLFAIGPITEQQFKVRLLGVLIAVIIGLAIDQARAEPQTRFYDSQGRSVGTAVPQGSGSVRYYDSRGNSLGTSTRPRRHHHVLRRGWQRHRPGGRPDARPPAGEVKMLVDFWNHLKPITRVWYQREWSLWINRLSPSERDAIRAEINRKIDAAGKTIVTTTWETPGPNWNGTPFQVIFSKATRHNAEHAAMCFGLFCQEVIMARPETWTSEHFEKDGVPIRGRTYFQI